MHVVVVSVKVKPGAENATRFESAIEANHLATRQEPGNLRFDVLKPVSPVADAEAPLEYVLYEVYHSAEDFTIHQQTPHYLAFRNRVEELMAEPRRGVHYQSLLPDPWHP